MVSTVPQGRRRDPHWDRHSAREPEEPCGRCASTHTGTHTISAHTEAQAHPSVHAHKHKHVPMCTRTSTNTSKCARAQAQLHPSVRPHKHKHVKYAHAQAPTRPSAHIHMGVHMHTHISAGALPEGAGRGALPGANQPKPAHLPLHPSPRAQVGAPTPPSPDQSEPTPWGRSRPIRGTALFPLPHGTQPFSGPASANRRSEPGQEGGVSVDGQRRAPTGKRTSGQKWGGAWAVPPRWAG